MKKEGSADEAQIVVDDLKQIMQDIIDLISIARSGDQRIGGSEKRRDEGEDQSTEDSNSEEEPEETEPPKEKFFMMTNYFSIGNLFSIFFCFDAQDWIPKL